MVKPPQSIRECRRKSLYRMSASSSWAHQRPDFVLSRIEADIASELVFGARNTQRPVSGRSVDRNLAVGESGGLSVTGLNNPSWPKTSFSNALPEQVKVSPHVNISSGSSCSLRQGVSIASVGFSITRGAAVERHPIAANFTGSSTGNPIVGFKHCCFEVLLQESTSCMICLT